MKKIIQLKVLLVFTLTSIISVAYAQPPGFMGKRLSVGLESNITPSYTGLIYALEPDVSLPLFNFRPGIQAEYVVTRNTALTIGVHSINTAFKANTRFVKQDPINDYPSFEIDDVIKLKGYDYELGANFYSSGLPAPLGSYFRIALCFISATPDFDTSAINLRAREANFTDTLFTFDPSDMLPYKTTALCMEWGKQRVIAERFSVKYSLGINFVLKPHSVFLDEIYDPNNDPPPATMEIFDPKVRDRIFNNYFITFKIGVGYLL